MGRWAKLPGPLSVLAVETMFLYAYLILFGNFAVSIFIIRFDRLNFLVLRAAGCFFKELQCRFVGAPFPT